MLLIGCKLSITITINTSAPIVCTTIGQRQHHEFDCHKYYECSPPSSLNGSIHWLLRLCPAKQAFNAELNRCSRDISDCILPIQCTKKGGINDPASNSSYYHCEPRYIDKGFRVYHIDCSSYELFYPLLGKCYIDFRNIPNRSALAENWYKNPDHYIVNGERKLLKAQDKLKLKQKQQAKEEERQRKRQAEEDQRKRWLAEIHEKYWLNMNI